MKYYLWRRMEEWRYSCIILDLGIRWRSVISPALPPGKRLLNKWSYFTLESVMLELGVILHHVTIISLIFSPALELPWALPSDFQFYDLFTDGRTPCRSDQPVARPLYLNTGQHKHRINTDTYQISMPCVRFEPTMSVSERAKTAHALDR
jgi:hypothetical protein